MYRFNLSLLKCFLLVSLVYLINDNNYCQETENSRVYEVKYTIAVFPCDITGNKVSFDTKVHTPPIGARFMMIKPLSSNKDTFIIRYLVWNKEKNPILYHYYNEPWIDSLNSQWPENSTNKNDAPKWPTRSPNWDSSGTKSYAINKFFLIGNYDLDSNCIKVHNTGLKSAVFTVGLVTMPLKLRLGSNFDFQGNLSLGSTAGAKIRLSRFNSNYINLLIGTSIATITLDSFNTKGKLSGQPLNNIAVFSPSVGAVFEFGRAQAGIFYGWDFLNKSTQLKYGWIYNKKPWFSIGFGFSILNIDGKSDKQPSKQSVSDSDLD